MPKRLRALARWAVGAALGSAGGTTPGADADGVADGPDADERSTVSVKPGYVLPTPGVPGASVNIERQDIRIAVPPTLPPGMVKELKRIFAEHPGGRRVYLMVRGKETLVDTKSSVAFSGDFIKQVESVLGRGAVLES